MRVITDETRTWVWVAPRDAVFGTEATVKVWVGDQRHVHTAEGNGPVNVIDKALRPGVDPRVSRTRPCAPH